MYKFTVQIPGPDCLKQGLASIFNSLLIHNDVDSN